MASQKEIQEQAARIAIFRSQMNQVVAEVTALFDAVDESKLTAIVSFGTAKLERDLAATEKAARLSLARAQAAADTGFIGGVTATFDQIKELTIDMGNAVNAYAKAVDAWNKIFPSETLAPILASVRDAVKNVVTGVAGTVGLLRYLPYMIVGGAVLFFVVPPLIRTIRAGRRGGADAALDVTAQEIDATRAGIGRQYREAQQRAIQVAPLLLGLEQKSRRRNRRRSK